MSAGKMLLIAVAVIGLSVHLWHVHQRNALAREMDAFEDSNGFVPVQMPNGAPRDTVVILAPVNCPSDGAQRADALARRLSALGIPNVRSNQYRASGVNLENRSNLERAVAVLKGDVPAVFINGKGKSNPTADEVTDEYRDDRPKT
jgi:hypothetical protein